MTQADKAQQFRTLHEAPNAFATGTDVIELEPGRSARASWGVDLLQ